MTVIVSKTSKKKTNQKPVTAEMNGTCVPLHMLLVFVCVFSSRPEKRTLDT